MPSTTMPSRSQESTTHSIKMLSLLMLLTSVAAAAASGEEFPSSRATRVSYIGCFRDKFSDRDLAALQHVISINDNLLQFLGVSSTDMTIEKCAAVCSLFNATYLGLQYRRQCYCANSYGNFGPKPESECNETCSGNASQICGGVYRNSIYGIEYLAKDPNLFIKENKPSKIAVKSTYPAPYHWRHEIVNKWMPVQECLLKCIHQPLCLSAAVTNNNADDDNADECQLFAFAALLMNVTLTNQDWQLWVRN